MNGRQNRQAAGRPVLQPIHRAPQAGPPPMSGMHHAPNAALLIDFDNVTMGIRSDLQTELRNLLASDIIKGKVAVQRAYADWRRYPQYIVPLAESSIDMIMAPAYGSSKKNATDIRLAIDALELVFTRPEIGTFILLSGDSDFSSLVIKLKEYGKYVIGVGIRESSSDLLVMNCDEYYSYTSLAGLVKSSDQETQKWDPWTLVSEAIQRMKRNGDVMRSDRLKQVMQDIDPSFDEKDLGMSKFSKFTAEAASRGLLSATRLENGQYEVGLPGGDAAGVLPPPVAAATSAPAASPNGDREPSEDRARRSRRGRGGRGRDRERPARETPASVAAIETPASSTPVASPAVSTPREESASIGKGGERLTRDEAFELVRRAVTALAGGPSIPRASTVRRKAHELLGRDSESLDRRMFDRILRDAHDANVVALKRRGEDFEVALVERTEEPRETVRAEPAAAAPAPAPPARGMVPRGMIAGRGRGGRGAELPPELLSIGVVDIPSLNPPPAEVEPAAEKGKKPRGRGAAAEKKTAEKKVPEKKPAPEKAEKPATERRRAPRAAKSAEPAADAAAKPRRPRGKRATAAAE